MLPEVGLHSAHAEAVGLLLGDGPLAVGADIADSRLDLVRSEGDEVVVGLVFASVAAGDIFKVLLLLRIAGQGVGLDARHALEVAVLAADDDAVVALSLGALDQLAGRLGAILEGAAGAVAVGRIDDQRVLQRQVHRHQVLAAVVVGRPVVRLVGVVALVVSLVAAAEALVLILAPVDRQPGCVISSRLRGRDAARKEEGLLVIETVGLTGAAHIEDGHVGRGAVVDDARLAEAVDDLGVAEPLAELRRVDIASAREPDFAFSAEGLLQVLRVLVADGRQAVDDEAALRLGAAAPALRGHEDVSQGFALQAVAHLEHDGHAAHAGVAQSHHAVPAFVAGGLPGPGVRGLADEHDRLHLAAELCLVERLVLAFEPGYAGCGGGGAQVVLGRHEAGVRLGLLVVHGVGVAAEEAVDPFRRPRRALAAERHRPSPERRILRHGEGHLLLAPVGVAGRKQAHSLI